MSLSVGLLVALVLGTVNPARAAVQTAGQPRRYLLAGCLIAATMAALVAWAAGPLAARAAIEPETLVIAVGLCVVALGVVQAAVVTRPEAPVERWSGALAPIGYPALWSPAAVVASVGVGIASGIAATGAMTLTAVGFGAVLGRSGFPQASRHLTRGVEWLFAALAMVGGVAMVFVGIREV